ncbi:hypothetical protein C0993_004237 [Termitomyces sp. T159_Od127]|nr:hypothetical protein C0993_004237 [Termitomyces sp. T159_Od127]
MLGSIIIALLPNAMSVVEALGVMTCYRPPGLQHSQNHPHNRLRPGPLPGQLPRPSPPITAHQRHSHRHSWHSPAITAVTTTSVPGLGYHITSAPAPPVAPDLRQDPPSRIMIAHHCHRPPLATPRSHSLLTAPPPRVSALPVRDLRAA